MKTTLKSAALSALILALLTAQQTSAFEAIGAVKLLLSAWKVHIVNDMKSQPLFVHCKSKDDDLGRQNLQMGQQFSWGFRENLWGTTLYWCYVRTQKSHAAFEAFWPDKDDWLAFRCQLRDCVWSVRDDGIFLRSNTQDIYERLHKWVPGGMAPLTP